MIIHAAVPEVGWRSQYETLPCASCRHFVAIHQTGHGAYTGWCEHHEPDDQCECEWPMIDTVEQIAVERGVPVERMREIVDAPRDEDGWPVGVEPLTEKEYFALQEHDSLQQSVEDGACPTCGYDLKLHDGEFARRWFTPGEPPRMLVECPKYGKKVQRARPA